MKRVAPTSELLILLLCTSSSFSSMKEKTQKLINYFTSVKLAARLKQKRTNLPRTVKTIRRKVPLSLRKKKKELHSFQFYKPGDITLTVYLGKANKNVLILCTMYKDIKISDNSKKTPEHFPATTKLSTELM